jgi:nitroreductase
MTDLEKLKHAPVSDGIVDIIASRWSPRAFSDKHVSSEDLEKIFTAAAWAASSANEQPWRFLFGRNGDAVFGRIFDSLAEPNQGWVKHVPVLVLSVGRNKFASGPYADKPNSYGLHDTGAASAYMSLQATALGLHTHGMGGFDHEKARAHFRIPADYDIGACWAIGYLGDPEALPERLKERELAPRSRKGISEFVFAEWEVPAKL